MLRRMYRIFGHVHAWKFVRFRRRWNDADMLEYWRDEACACGATRTELEVVI